MAAGTEGPPLVMIVPTWCGLPEEGEARLTPCFKLGTLLASAVNVMPYGASLTVFDPYIANGQRTFIDVCLLPVLDSGSIDVFVDAMAAAVSPSCAIFTHEFKGAASRIPVEATAFGLRRDHVLVELLASFVDRSDKVEERRYQQWIRTTLHAFHEMVLPGGYPNLLPDGDADRATKSHGRNAERLIEAKRRYDPDNVFRSVIPLPVSGHDLGGLDEDVVP